ncbi:hypothetical protein HU200_066356 [Digitaria exilis]|uniref:Leucine-rich repeat-containing N-terminal plant-type domain-containing protein n=1 Tax=Digitaria exilis TaxID=1010633 RepID=A0A835A232_9POAL|nr:hypothetical protein HU200_066356 [Digitaria exilis]
MHVTTNAPHLLTIISTTLFLIGSAQQHQQPDASSCIHSERAALLSFRKGVTFDHTNRLATWHGQDCCRWKGVKCSNETGHVLELRLRSNDENALSGQISSSLLSLEHLEHLDLSGNCVVEYGKNIPSFLGSMKNLRYLNLSFIPSIGEVKNLQLLQYLSMRRVNLSQIFDWPQILNGIPSLRVIDFHGCSLYSAKQSLPHMNLTKLHKLELSSNSFYHEIAYSWFWKATSLKYLDLSDHGFFGEFHDALENMSSLQVLDLSFNNRHYNLSMKVFQNNLVMKGNYKNLCSLEILDLSFNGINGDINELIGRLPPCTWDKLQELQLGLNNFTGTLPNLMGHFTNLIILDLTDNNLIGSIPMELGYLSGLTTLHLGYNHLNGTVPTKIGGLANLISLDLSNNKFDGIITDEHFAGLISLKEINLASSNLKVVVGAHGFPPFRLQNARFASCTMGTPFPPWLELQNEITELDLSSNALIDKIPDWFWQTFSLATDIDISNNQLSGTLPADLSGMSCLMLNLSSNNLTGTIPQFPRNITTLDISRNSFAGPLPSIEAPQLKIVLMFSNQIGGTIPESFCTLKELLDLDLSSNALEGEIPHCFEFKDITFLQLSNNSLSGHFPAFLRKCTYLGFLDLGWNKLFGSLPEWIGEVTNYSFYD